MRKLSYMLLTALASIAIASCGDNDIEGWNSKYVWFTDTIVDFSNMQQPDVPEGGTLVAAIPLSMASEVAGQDRIVNVEVVGQPKDSRTKFEVQNPVKIRAGRLVDTMYVNITNSKHLDEVYDSITFRVLPSADFEPGLTSNQEVTLCLHNGYSRPDWWDTRGEQFLGYFTQLKMEIFVKVTGSTDDPRSMSSWSTNDIQLQYWIFLLNDYIKQNDIRYPNDDPNKPGEQPLFDFWEY
ncbi:MAG: DUF4843 domain-containing protein [Prevotella sp.]